VVERGMEAELECAALERDLDAAAALVGPAPHQQCEHDVQWRDRRMPPAAREHELEHCGTARGDRRL